MQQSPRQEPSLVLKRSFFSLKLLVYLLSGQYYCSKLLNNVCTTIYGLQNILRELENNTNVYHQNKINSNCLTNKMGSQMSNDQTRNAYYIYKPYVTPTPPPPTKPKVIPKPEIKPEIKPEPKPELKHKPVRIPTPQAIVEANVIERTEYPADTDLSRFSFTNIDDLLELTQFEFERFSLNWSVREKCRLVKHLLYIENKQIKKDQEYANIRKMKMADALSCLNPPLMAEIKSTNRALPDVYKITFDALCIILRLPLRSVSVVPIRISQKLVVQFWHDSFAQSGQELMGPLFDFRADLTRLSEGKSINDQMLELLEPLINSQWFCQETVSRVSKAIGIIVDWVRNLFEYAKPGRHLGYRSEKISRIQRWVDNWMKRNALEIYMETNLL